MTIGELQKKHFHLSVLFFFLALLMLAYIGFPIFSGLFGRGVFFFNGSDKSEWWYFFLATCVPVAIFLASIVLMNVFFVKSGYGANNSVKWGIPIAICVSLMIIFLAATSFLWIILFCFINYIVFLIGFEVLMLNAVGLCMKGAQKNSNK